MKVVIVLLVKNFIASLYSYLIYTKFLVNKPWYKIGISYFFKIWLFVSKNNKVLFIKLTQPFVDQKFNDFRFSCKFTDSLKVRVVFGNLIFSTLSALLFNLTSFILRFQSSSCLCFEGILSLSSVGHSKSSTVKPRNSRLLGNFQLLQGIPLF